jgi:hypothetical protein
MLLGSPFVAALRVFGIPPTIGASLYSLVWETLAVVGLVILVRRLSDSIWLATGIGLLFAVIEPVWVHGVLAEVYSVSMALSVAVLYFTFDLRESWSDRRGWLLAFLEGASVAHHRLLALLLIPVGLYLLPMALRSRSFPRWLAIASLCFGAGFLPYLDIPLRIWLGSTWNYDQANTWQGFWRIFRGEEVARLQQPDLSIPALLSAAKDIYRVLVSELTWPGVVLIGLATVRGAWQRPTRSATRFVMALGGSYVLFTLFFRHAVLIQATLMSTLLALCILLGIGLSTLRSSWRNVAALICFGWAAWLAIGNWSFVTSLTRDLTAVDYAATVEQLEAPSGSLVMAPWGANYFALAYAQRVEGRMAQWRIVDHRADFHNLSASSCHRVYTHASTLYILGADWWAERLGSPLRIASAGPQMVMLTSEPLDAPTRVGIALGDGIVLTDWEIRPIGREKLNVVLYWSATHTPTADYCTFVHVSDQDTISKPEDLIAQSDYGMPVYGLYPTSRWVPNETIREDHLLQVPLERPPKTIVIGMYRRDVTGAFFRLGQVLLKYQDGMWLVSAT